MSHQDKYFHSNTSIPPERWDEVFGPAEEPAEAPDAQWLRDRHAAGWRLTPEARVIARIDAPPVEEAPMLRFVKTSPDGQFAECMSYDGLAKLLPAAREFFEKYRDVRGGSYGEIIQTADDFWSVLEAIYEEE